MWEDRRAGAWAYVGKAELTDRQKLLETHLPNVSWR